MSEIAVIGGDVRQAATAEALVEAGHKVCVFGIDAQLLQGAVFCANLSRALMHAAAVVLPLPVTHDGEHIPCDAGDVPVRFSEILHKVQAGTVLMGGYIPQPFFEMARAQDVPLYDYYTSEEVTLRNACATAEGAIAVAIANTDTVLCGLHAAVIGFGRIGRMLARLLYALGVHVTVYARSSEARTWAEIEGYAAAELCDGGVPASIVSGFGIVFNTVPARVLCRARLTEMSKDTLLVELASKPGGFDPADARDAGLRTVYAQGLPGRYAPVSAGRAIAVRVLEILREREESAHESNG